MGFNDVNDIMMLMIINNVTYVYDIIPNMSMLNVTVILIG